MGESVRPPMSSWMSAPPRSLGSGSPVAAGEMRRGNISLNGAEFADEKAERRGRLPEIPLNK